MVLLHSMAAGEALKGVVAAETVEVRFAFSGRVAQVLKKPGERVRRGELLAALETNILQAELDRELADYERARADFELFGLRVKDPQTDVEKYEKVRMQGFLDAAVKAVELVKLRMDQTKLPSPVEGIVVSDGGLRAGLYITPGSYGFELTDLATLHLALEVSWGELERFPPQAEVKIKVEGNQEVVGRVLPLLPNPKRNTCLLRLGMAHVEGIWPGMAGEIV